MCSLIIYPTLCYIIHIAGGFGVRASATYSGGKISVSYEAAGGAVCTCQLDSGSPESCKNYVATLVATSPVQ